ncbi:MAG: ferredoxin [Kibdelosporangium sp.]
MTQPPHAPMTPDRRNALIAEIARVLAATVPPGWGQLRAEYRAAGRHVEAEVIVIGAAGQTRSAPPPDLVRLLAQLRAGMYQPGRGTWLGGSVEIDATGGLRTDFTLDAEPRWWRVPPPVGFADELRFFPRAAQHIPGWWRHRAGLPGPQPSAEPVTPPVDGPVRMPRVWDGLDADGRPVAARPPVPDIERERILGYLEACPVVIAARHYDVDRFVPDTEPKVPLNFHTDGVWVWPGAVSYYLREHNLPPDPDLVAHLRARRFATPEVDEPARERAIAAVTAG